MKQEEIYKNIDKISEIARGFMKSQILLVANELNIFSIIGKEGKDLNSIISEIKTDRRATEILLDALIGSELLTKEGSLYKNSPITSELLITGKEYYQGDMLKHLYNVRTRWAELLNVVNTGKPAKTGREIRKFSHDETRSFILAMANIGKFSVEELISAIDLSKSKKILDLGGGPGSYSIAFCKKYPSLEATVFDLPEVIPITKEQINEAGLNERVHTIEGDYLINDYGGPYDTVVISNIIHSLGKNDILTIFKKSAKALSEGGKILIKDFFPNENRTGPSYPLIFAVNMLVSTKEGNTYTETEVAEWLKESGFKEVRFLDITYHSKAAEGTK